MFDLVEMQRGREPLLPEAQRLVRTQREIAHGFHRQVKTNLIVRSCYRGPTNRLLRRAEPSRAEPSRAVRWRRAQLLIHKTKVQFAGQYFVFLRYG